MAFTDWLQERVSPESQRVMKHFEHRHTAEEAAACLQSIRDSQRLMMQYTWLWLAAEAVLTVVMCFVMTELWQFAAWLVFCFFAHRLASPWFKSLRKPIKWACRRLS